jgi:hypothetical protein
MFNKVENINISVNEANQEKPIIIHLLEGPAPEPQKVIQPESVTISGDIIAPVDYAIFLIAEDKRNSPDFAIVTYSDNPKSPWIKLVIGANQSIKQTVTGTLMVNKDLNDFHFNEAAFFTNKTFADMILKKAYCFALKGEAKALRKSLQNYQAKFNTIVQKNNDNQGNTEDMIKTEFDKTGSGIPPVINLKMPLFDGGPDVEFTAEVEIEVVMTSGKPEARFAFFTEELDIQQRAGAKEIVQSQIEQLSKAFVCIRQNI